MKVEIEYETAVRGTVTMDVDEEEVRAWLKESDPLYHEPLIGSDVRRFLLAGESEVWESQLPWPPDPGEVMDNELLAVKLPEEIKA